MTLYKEARLVTPRYLTGWPQMEQLTSERLPQRLTANPLAVLFSESSALLSPPPWQKSWTQYEVSCLPSPDKSTAQAWRPGSTAWTIFLLLNHEKLFVCEVIKVKIGFSSFQTFSSKSIYSYKQQTLEGPLCASTKSGLQPTAA